MVKICWSNILCVKSDHYIYFIKAQKTNNELKIIEIARIKRLTK